MLEFAVLCLAAFFAGLVDAVVGGGGLIQVPALFSAYPQHSAATLFGTNKIASVFGTSTAAWQYGKRVAIPWWIAGPATVAALIFSYIGAMAVAYFPPALLRPVILVLLVLVAAYTFVKKDLGQIQNKHLSGVRAAAVAFAVGATMGFYDGFFGPGTGSFLIFLFVRFFGLDFLHASASAKIVNVATNIAALAFFVPHGNVMLSVGLAMAVCNMSGAMVGAKLAMRHGSRFIRQAFLIVVVALIAKLGWGVLLG